MRTRTITLSPASMKSRGLPHRLERLPLACQELQRSRTPLNLGRFREDAGRPEHDIGFEAFVKGACLQLAVAAQSSDGVEVMETINGCTVVLPSEATEPARFGPAETEGSYVVLVGTFPPGEPGPPLHLHPHTDEAFYVADGDATFQLGDRELRVTPAASSSYRGGRPTPCGTPGTARFAG